jgi:ESS family glutamate:Na+ symporter
VTCSPVFAAALDPLATAGLSLGPFALLLLSVPVLLVGEGFMKRAPWLARFNIPTPILSGLVIALGLLWCAEFRPGWIALQGSTAAPLWLWPVLPQWDLAPPRLTDVERPLLILFFTCIGLNASWSVARRGGWPLVLYLLVAAGIALLQTGAGILSASFLGQSPLFGLMTSSVSLMGGFGTAAGFAPEFEKAGLAGAATIGIAAAAFGVIAGGLIAGPVAGRLVRTKLGRQGEPNGVPPPPDAAEPAAASGLIQEIRDLARTPGSTLLHLAVLFGCMKLGAFVSAYFQRAGITFPVYMGSMIVAAFARNLHDLFQREWLTSERTDGIASVALMWLLTVVMIDLQLSQLAHAAWPLLVILTVQVVLTSAAAYWIVFRVMGSDYEAATMSAGMIGFGLGATSNAVATMRVLARRFGPAPRAFLIVTVVGAFLIDFINAVLITTALNLFK